MPVQNPNEVNGESVRKYERRGQHELSPESAPMSLSQASYLMTLCEETHEILDDSLSQAQAARLIERLEEATGRRAH